MNKAMVHTVAPEAHSVAAQEPPSLADICRELLDEHGDIGKAALALEAQAKADDALYKRVVNGAFLSMCRKRIMAISTADRRIVFPSAPTDGSLDEDAMVAWAGAVAEGIMDTFRLPGGQALGDATKAEVMAGAYAYASTRDDAAIKSRFLNQVAEAMPAKGTVRQSLTEAKLETMRAEARKLRIAA